MARQRKKSTMSKRKKWVITGVAGIALLGGGYMVTQAIFNSGMQAKQYTLASANKGSLASSTILSGKAKSVSEQYVYYDPSKGTNPIINVSVGDQVAAGQALVQYDSTSAQIDYDSAVRALNNAGNAITTFKRDNAAIAGTTEYNSQLQELNNAYADAQGNVDKAQLALNATTVNSDVTGTVVEVAESINPSTQTSQTLVHVASEGQIQIQGTLTEYDLANVKVGQNVKIKSKVYPDKEWTGTISYISNYPNEKSDSNNASGSGDSSSSSSSSATYDYKVDITSDLGDLKQGFTTSVEVEDDTESIIVPVKAVVTQDDKSYVWVYDNKNGKITKTEVVLGKADGKNQQISSGLNEGQTVIGNPSKDLKDGQDISGSVDKASYSSKTTG
ncbi:efflux RND transporter periplasmic adaptor subunit [Streptococcus dentapri]|uniref:Efflux RND transporter periplasmic adaptor subunit n=1 Tax=Streptococcus dentapri TaxID=573564 RepID=A0ABV8D0B2_9STRE